MVQVIDFPIISNNANPFDEICKDLFPKKTRNTLNDSWSLSYAIHMAKCDET